jgi:hypothetical protein
MYPRNAASPERISIGAVVQISDGAVQSSGVAVKVIPFGGSESSGAGTVAYSADGVVLYTPTQGETNYTSFILVASKTGCIPATVTVVTSAAGIASIVTSVYAALPADHTVNGSYGARLLLAMNTPREVKVTGGGSGHVAADVHAFQPDVIDAAAIAADAVTEIQGVMPDRLGYLLSILAGAISDAGTAAETYQITLNSSTFTVDFSGLDATGNRTGATLTKT